MLQRAAENMSGNIIEKAVKISFWEIKVMKSGM